MKGEEEVVNVAPKSGKSDIEKDSDSTLNSQAYYERLKKEKSVEQDTEGDQVVTLETREQEDLIDKELNVPLETNSSMKIIENPGMLE